MHMYGLLGCRGEMKQIFCSVCSHEMIESEKEGYAFYYTCPNCGLIFTVAKTNPGHYVPGENERIVGSLYAGRIDPDTGLWATGDPNTWTYITIPANNKEATKGRQRRKYLARRKR
jgi:hypothetical protein